MLSWCLDPFCRDGDKLENKALDSASGSQSKLLGLQSLHDGFVEVSDEGSHGQENRIL